MLKIIEEKQNDLERLKILNENTGEYLSIIPAFGANINEIVFKKGNKLFDIIDGNKDRASFKNNDIFKGANLMPFPNRLKDGRYTFNGIEYQLPKNYQSEGNAAHGFIYDKPFEIINQKSDINQASVILGYDYDGSISGYPFLLNIQYEFILDSVDGFECKTKVENCGESDIPFACGWHPFFMLNKKVDKLKLRFSPKNRILLDTNLIPTGLTEKCNQFMTFTSIGDQQLDSCFKLSEMFNIHYSELLDEDENLKIVFWQETGSQKYNYLQIYIPPSRESISIEPMTASVNAFNNHDGLIILGKGQRFTAKYGVKLL